MRSAALALFTLALGACDVGEPRAPVETIDIRLSRPWLPNLDISLKRGANGRYDEDQSMMDAPHAASLAGDFAFSTEGFEKFAAQSEEFRRQSTSAEAVMKQAEAGCPPGSPTVSDRGTIYIRWRSKEADEHFLAQLGCDVDRNAAQYQRLHDLIRTLPLPPA